MEKLNELLKKGVSRRTFLAGASASAGTAAVATLAAGCGSAKLITTTPTPTQTPLPTAGDFAILNFALNLEYLEAEYYLRATTGSGLAAADTGSSAGTVVGGAQVNFTTPALGAYALELAADEQRHVQLLRSALGSSAVSRPNINFTDAFTAAAIAAGIVPAGGSFNPFADELSFMVGAFVFEDVGVTAYHGASTLWTDKGYLQTAAGIMAVEAYHAAEIRTVITYLGDPYLTYANQISALRGAASKAASPGTADETALSGSTVIAADSNSIAYDRTTDQVLHIVYLNATPGPVSKGGFFPNGLNGTITASAS